MPFLTIKVNMPLDNAMASELMTQGTNIVARVTGKPKSYIMLNISGDEHLMMGGKIDPCCYMEMKSIGLPDEQIRPLSAELTKMMMAKLHVPANRIYIEFSAVPGKYWGYNGSTF